MTTHSRPKWWLVLFVLLSVVSGVAATEAELAKMPMNAHAKRYGSGWDCDRGYEKVDQSCVAIEVPSNGYLNSSGRDWDCERGFKKGLRSCLALQVPMNAHVGYSGDRWTCDPGYRQQGETCTEDKR